MDLFTNNQIHDFYVKNTVPVKLKPVLKINFKNSVYWTSCKNIIWIAWNFIFETMKNKVMLWKFSALPYSCDKI
jgi:hypothetical protein